MLFVPVILNFGVVKYTVPSAYIAVGATGALFHGKWLQSLWAFGLLLFYLVIFYTLALITFLVASRPSSRGIRTAIQTAVLLALFSCSFLKVLTYSSIQGNGGTYNFWGAVQRCFEKRHW